MTSVACRQSCRPQGVVKICVVPLSKYPVDSLGHLEVRKEMRCMEAMRG